MNYILKADLFEMIELRKIFSEACQANGLNLSNKQQTAILTKFIEDAQTAGLLVEITEGGTEG